MKYAEIDRTFEIYIGSHNLQAMWHLRILDTGEEVPLHVIPGGAREGQAALDAAAGELLDRDLGIPEVWLAAGFSGGSEGRGYIA